MHPSGVGLMAACHATVNIMETLVVFRVFLSFQESDCLQTGVLLVRMDNTTVPSYVTWM